MGVRDIYKSKSNLLNASDIKGRVVKVKITAVETREFQNGEKKLVLTFENKEKKLALGKNNAMSMMDRYGEDENAWIGHEIELFTDKVTMNGQVKDSIKVRTFAPTTSKDFNDDIPF